MKKGANEPICQCANMPICQYANVQRLCIHQPETCNLQSITSNLKLKAFTIFEMMVTLVLSGIIISASMMLYLNYESLIRGKTKQMNSGKETLQFYHIFTHEFNNAVMVNSSGYTTTFMMPVSSPVRYEFEQDFITRVRENMADTFFITVNDFKVVKDDVTGFDKIITMELKNGGEIFPITLIKEYSNEVMMNKSTHQ